MVLEGRPGFIITSSLLFQGPSFSSAALVGICKPTRRDGYIPLLGDTEYGWVWNLSKNTENKK